MIVLLLEKELQIHGPVIPVRRLLVRLEQKRTGLERITKMNRTRRI
jgi:hypothetical protein